MALDIGHIVERTIGEAENHRFHQSLFDCSRYLWLCEDIGGGFREMTRFFV